MAASVKREDKGDSGAQRREHGKGRDKGMDALAMDEIPGFLPDDAGDLWGKVVISIGWPGTHTPDLNPVDFFSRWEPLTRICRQHGHINTSSGQSFPNLMHMCLDPSHKREVSWGHEQHAHWPRLSRLCVVVFTLRSFTHDCGHFPV
jgi:hypothetical protein